jgi:hypothetical protein
LNGGEATGVADPTEAEVFVLVAVEVEKVEVGVTGCEDLLEMFAFVGVLV